MARLRDRDFYGYIPGFAVIVVLAGVLAFAPAMIPRQLREAVGLAPSREVPVQQAGTLGTYAFTAHQDGDPDAPVGYDPCKPVKLKVNPENAPADYLDLVTEALSRVGAAAGLRLEYDGTTDERPQWESAYVPVFLGAPRSRAGLIAWADSDEVPELAGRVAGVGGSVAIEDQGGRIRYVTGGVTLDRGLYGELMETPEGRAQARAILLHELGHLLGLDHVDDENELMNADNLGKLDFGPGDLAGLARVGAGSCA
jgi:hypothetical protein